MVNLLLRFFVFIFIFFSFQVSAAPWLQKTNQDFVKAELVSETTSAVPASTMEVGILLTHNPKWHTYWKATGDSGLPTTIEWNLPEGWSAGPIQWPIPKVFTLGDLINYGYDGKVLLPVQLTVPADAKPGSEVHLSAKVSWLMCENQCIPGGATVSLTLPVQKETTDSSFAPLFKSTFEQIPQEDKKVSAKIDEQKKLIELTFSDTGSIEEFYLFAEGDFPIVYSAPQEIFPTTNGFAVYLKATDNIKQGEPFSGLLVINKGPGNPNGAAFSFSTKLQGAAITMPEKNAEINTVSLLMTAFFAFIGGLILNLMPCVFPVLSLKILGIVENRGAKHLWSHGVGFLAGILLTMIGLALLLIFIKSTGAAVGWGFQLQSPYFVSAMVLLFVGITVNLLGFFEFTAGSSTAGQLTMKSNSDTKPFTDSFLTGVLAVFVASPCTAPFMGAALGYALSATLTETLLIFCALGLGMALPWFVLSVCPFLTSWLPKPGKWMITFKKVMAIPMALTTVWLLWVLSQQVDTVALAGYFIGAIVFATAFFFLGRYQFGVISSKDLFTGLFAASLIIFGAVSAFVHFSPKPEIVETVESWSQQKVEQALSEKKPVFVDFTASWCVTCQANKLTVLKTAEIQEAFKKNNFVVLEADWTRYDENITKVLQHFGRSGVPLYIIYRPNGTVEILPELLTKSIVLEAIDNK